MIEWIALSLSALVYAGFLFGSYRVGSWSGAALGLAITGIFFWLTLTG